jgi:hypothetical protein
MHIIEGNGQHSDVLSRIDALTQERGKVLRQGQFLSADQRTSKIQDIDKELALLWAQRRAELSAVEMLQDPALGPVVRHAPLRSAK